jgi:preprotein translocase subunit YajC
LVTVDARCREGLNFLYIFLIFILKKERKKERKRKKRNKEIKKERTLLHLKNT